MSIELTEKIIVNKLFNFIEEYFDKFECKGSSFGWWRSPNSWSPFVETCFVLWGEELRNQKQIEVIGHAFTHSNITKFMKTFDKDYNKSTKYSLRGFDVSWHDKNRLILTLEHEETARGIHSGQSSTIKNNLENIYGEMDKLLYFPAEFKIIVSRPRLGNGCQNYQQAIEHYKNKIGKKLSSFNPSENDKWLSILIGPTNNLKPSEEAEISFCSYVWDKNELAPACAEKRFKVGMNGNFEVKRIYL